MQLTPATEKFILHWGEMGTRWGINRTVAQIHALLYISPEPLNAEDITNTLGVARSNVSTSLKELQSWGIVRVVHVLGDRRDYFESLHDVWEMFRIILNERKHREIDPTRKLIAECLDEVDKGDKHTRQRLEALDEFFDATTAWYSHVSRLPNAALKQFLRLGGRIEKLIAPGRKK